MTKNPLESHNNKMSQQFESEFEGYKNIQLFYQGWETTSPKGSVVLVHGQAEHSDCYDHFAKALNKRGWNTYAYDMRGHGKSEGQRGYAANFDDYEKDLTLFIQHVAKNHKHKGPKVLFGHSMGGLLSLKSIIANGNQGLSALALSSPALGLAVEIPIYKQKLAELFSDYIPRLTMFNEIQPEDLTADPEMLNNQTSDSLRHHKISPKVFIGMKHGFEQVFNLIDQINLPLILQISDNDPVVSSEASKKFFELLPVTNKILYTYKNSKHEILNDVEREQVMTDCFDFIDQFIDKEQTT